MRFTVTFTDGGRKEVDLIPPLFAKKMAEILREILGDHPCTSLEGTFVSTEAIVSRLTDVPFADLKTINIHLSVRLIDSTTILVQSSPRAGEAWDERCYVFGRNGNSYFPLPIPSWIQIIGPDHFRIRGDSSNDYLDIFEGKKLYEDLSFDQGSVGKYLRTPRVYLIIHRLVRFLDKSNDESPLSILLTSTQPYKGLGKQVRKEAILMLSDFVNS